MNLDDVISSPHKWNRMFIMLMRSPTCSAQPASTLNWDRIGYIENFFLTGKQADSDQVRETMR